MIEREYKNKWKFKISDVDVKYRVGFTGEYNASISRCVECDHDHRCTLDHVVGFAGSKEGFVCLIWECEKCFQKSWYHSSEMEYENYLEYLEDMADCQEGG